MLIRKAKKEDFDQYYQLQKEFIDYMNNYNPNDLQITPIKKDLKENFLNLIKNKDRILLIIEEDKTIIGFLDSGIITFKNTGWKYKYNKVGHLYDAFITKNYRGKGYFKKALAILEKELKQKGINKLNLMAEVFNKNAINVYHKLGFKILNYKMWKELKK